MSDRKAEKRVNQKQKIIQDTVHGGIYIPSSYCREIIDTIPFQRLRRIEQTSMRSIFPSARHDRFTHSLGTYHLGEKIFDKIYKNSSEELDLTSHEWESIGESYKLACLLHDCGHSPFSHTFEKYYDKPNCLNDILKNLASDNNFSSDIDFNSDAKEHEKVSAIIVLQYYREKLMEFKADPILIARMIIGCKYINPKDDYLKIANCFIQLLNGHIIDADRLDYIKRDRWASGYNTINLDVERLLSSMCIKKDEKSFRVCFHKNALSEIPHVLEAKDFQSSWVFSHHKVSYDQYILVKAVEKLAMNLNPSLPKEQAISKLFNINSFIDPNYFVNETIKLYMPCDDDIVFLLKSDISNNEYAAEWFSRKHKLKPLWKSFAEYNSLFKEELKAYAIRENGRLHRNLQRVVEEELKAKGIPESDYGDSYYIKEIRAKGTNINTNDIYVYVNRVISYDMLVSTKALNEECFFPYVFISRELDVEKDDLIRKMIVSSE